MASGIVYSFNYKSWTWPLNAKTIIIFFPERNMCFYLSHSGLEKVVLNAPALWGCPSPWGFPLQMSDLSRNEEHSENLAMTHVSCSGGQAVSGVSVEAPDHRTGNDS